jgi:hypothetical protein
LKPGSPLTERKANPDTPVRRHPAQGHAISMLKAKPPFRRPWSKITAIEAALIASLIAVFLLAAAQTMGLHAQAAF